MLVREEKMNNCWAVFTFPLPGKLKVPWSIFHFHCFSMAISSSVISFMVHNVPSLLMSWEYSLLFFILTLLIHEVTMKHLLTYHHILPVLVKQLLWSLLISYLFWISTVEVFLPCLSVGLCFYFLYRLSKNFLILMYTNLQILS